MPDVMTRERGTDTATPPAPGSVRQALGQTPWLRQVPATTLDRMAQHAVLHRVPSGSVLFRQSEIPSFALLLVSGCVELVGVAAGAEALIETVLPVDLLLPAAVLNRQPYLADGRVLDEALLVLIHADAFRAAIAADHALCLAVLACQAAHFRRQVKLAKNLQLRSAEDRVGCYLLRLVVAAGPRGPIRLPLEKRRIAWQLGMTRETFSRTLAAMARYGLRVSGDVIEINDAAALGARFQLDPLTDMDEPVVPLGAALA